LPAQRQPVRAVAPAFFFLFRLEQLADALLIATNSRGDRRPASRQFGGLLRPDRAGGQQQLRRPQLTQPESDPLRAGAMLA